MVGLCCGYGTTYARCSDASRESLSHDPHARTFTLIIERPIHLLLNILPMCCVNRGSKASDVRSLGADARGINLAVISTAIRDHGA